MWGASRVGSPHRRARQGEASGADRRPSQQRKPKPRAEDQEREQKRKRTATERYPASAEPRYLHTPPSAAWPPCHSVPQEHGSGPGRRDARENIGTERAIVAFQARAIPNLSQERVLGASTFLQGKLAQKHGKINHCKARCRESKEAPRLCKNSEAVTVPRTNAYTSW